MSRNIAILTLAGIVTVVACGGGGGGGATGPIFDDSTTLVGSFIADETTPDNLEVTLRQESASANLVTVQVNVTATEDVYAAGFDLTWDPARVEFKSWQRGTLLEEGGYTPLYTVQARSGQLSAGMTRSGTVPGALVNRGTLIRLTFVMLRTGDAPVAIENAFLLDSQPPAPAPIEGVTWHGGTFRVTEAP